MLSVVSTELCGGIWTPLCGRMLVTFLVVGLTLVLTASSSGCRAPGAGGTWAQPGVCGPVTAWPRPVPARLHPADRDEILVTTLGDVHTPLAEGTFDPTLDRMTLADGTVIDAYYRGRLDVPWYVPLDKSVYPLPPSGWCSWYYYYQELDSAEVLANARWIAEHLRDYGARYVQIDDAWQGVGRGLGDNRDWTTIDTRFRELGMDGLAAKIRELGLEAGIWLAPHGQSNEQVARAGRSFLWKPDGTSASDTWEGKFLVDPSVPEGLAYLRELFTRLAGWGYTYFKIDGQPIVLEQYDKCAANMGGAVELDKNPGGRAPRLYRDTLQAIRAAIGPQRYLLGCWGIPLPGVGIMNGSRTSGDIVQGRDGLLIAAKAVQQWNFLHNIAWYCDPDVFMVRPPLNEGVARAWATLQGLTGQALLTSDRLPDLPPSRIELLKRVYPAVDIRPLDLFKRGEALCPLWDLKVAHLGRNYDVIGAFNFDERSAETRYISWADLGLDPQQRYHVYDFWQGAYLGAWAHGIFVEVPPTDVRVLTLVPAGDEPVLISTSRHITQGWVDLLALTRERRGAQVVLRGRSRVLADDSYTLTVGLPPQRASLRLVSATARGPQGVEVRSLAHQGYATLTLRSARTQEVDWEMHFGPARGYVYPVNGPEKLQVAATGPGQAAVTWTAPYHPQAGFLVSLDGSPLGVAFHCRAVLRDLQPGQIYKISVASVWSDGSAAPKPGEIEYVCNPPS